MIRSHEFFVLRISDCIHGGTLLCIGSRVPGWQQQDLIIYYCLPTLASLGWPV